MKENALEKHSLAWFKLTEFVTRGEKERAMGIYKLLSLSFDNPAFAEQLQADLLSAFEDPDAEKKYLQSADLYIKQKEISIAIAVYEHLITLKPKSLRYWELLIKTNLEFNPDSYTLNSIIRALKTLDRNSCKSILTKTINLILEKNKNSLKSEITAKLQEIDQEYFELVSNI